MKWGERALESLGTFETFKDQLGKDMVEVFIDGMLYKFFVISSSYDMIAYFLFCIRLTNYFWCFNHFNLGMRLFLHPIAFHLFIKRVMYSLMIYLLGWVQKRLMKLYIDCCNELSEAPNLKLLKKLYISEVGCRFNW